MHSADFQRTVGYSEVPENLQKSFTEQKEYLMEWTKTGQITYKCFS